ncbi:hypothetical protein [Paenibacillus pinihumi]|uniref:hypothetical protein n=1 Tax=Paenibacillus pinihumi TaxID=669462 RepID=UPI00041159C1|nr:hypothetical protein [Paenibacillus pinihumi]
MKVIVIVDGVSRINIWKLFKLLLLITGIVLLNIVVLSPGFIGVEIGGDSVFQTAAGVTLLVISLIVILYQSYVVIYAQPVVEPVPVKNIQTREDYIAALQKYSQVTVLDKDIALALDQLERIEKKKLTLEDVLGQRFEETELSYRKFKSVIYEVEKLFYLNIRGILNKLGVFDVSEFIKFAQQQKTMRFSSRLVQEKTALYNEYLSYVSGYLNANEEILLKLDKLLLEISLLGSADYNDVEEMPCMKEIDLLIKQTKFYK